MLEIVYHQLTEAVNHASTLYADKPISKLPRIIYYKEDRYIVLDWNSEGDDYKLVIDENTIYISKVYDGSLESSRFSDWHDPDLFNKILTLITNPVDWSKYTIEYYTVRATMI